MLTGHINGGQVLLITFIVFAYTFTFTNTLNSNLLTTVPPVTRNLVLSVINTVPVTTFNVLPRTVITGVTSTDSGAANRSHRNVFCTTHAFTVGVNRSITVLLFANIDAVNVTSNTNCHVTTIYTTMLYNVNNIIFTFCGRHGILSILRS